MKTRTRSLILAGLVTAALCTVMTENGAAAVPTSSSAPSPTASATPHAATSAPSMTIVETGSNGFEAGVLAYTQSNPAQVSSAKAILKSLLESASSGNPTNIEPTNSLTPSQTSNVLTNTMNALSGASAPAPATGTHSLRDNAAAQPLAANPDNYPVAGAAGVPSHYVWRIPAPESSIDDIVCSEGSCVALDVIQCSWTVNPSLTSDLSTFICHYSPNHHNFSDIYADLYTFCDGGSTQCGAVVCPKAGSHDGEGDGKCTVTHRAVENDRIKQGIDLRGTYDPKDTEYNSRVGTGHALCGTGTTGTRNCIYGL